LEARAARSALQSQALKEQNALLEEGISSGGLQSEECRRARLRAIESRVSAVTPEKQKDALGGDRIENNKGGGAYPSPLSYSAPFPSTSRGDFMDDVKELRAKDERAKLARARIEKEKEAARVTLSYLEDKAEREVKATGKVGHETAARLNALKGAGGGLAMEASVKNSVADLKEESASTARRMEFDRVRRDKEESRRAELRTRITVLKEMADREMRERGVISDTTSNRLKELEASLVEKGVVVSGTVPPGQRGFSSKEGVSKLVEALTIQTTCGSGRTAAVTILQIVGNICGSPGEVKWRRLRLSSELLREKVFLTAGGKELLFAMGFVEEDGFLVFEGGDLSLLKHCSSAIIAARGKW